MDKIHERIRKLLELAASPNNENEAAAAAAAAQRLMFQHSISAEQLEIKEENLVTDECYRAQGKQLQYWRHILVTGVAKASDCRAFRRDNTLQLFGPQAAVQTVRYIYAYLDRTIEQLCDQNYAVLTADSPKRARASFKLGAAEAVCYRLWQAYNANKQELERNPHALMIVNNKLARVEKAYEDMSTRSSRRAPNADDNMRALGQAAGKAIPLDNKAQLGQSVLSLKG